MGKKNSGQDLVSVYAAQGQLRAAVIKSALESAGIPVTIDGIGRVYVLVPAEWADEARDLLDADAVESDVE